MTNSTIGNFTTVSIKNPTGITIKSGYGINFSLNNVPLTVSGPHSIVINPNGTLTGQITVTLTATPGGSVAIYGFAIPGHLLSAAADFSSPPASSIAYQWLRCDGGGASCVDLFGKTSSLYTVDPGDLNSTLRVKATGTNSKGATTIQSAPTPVVQTPLYAFSPQLLYDSQETYRADSAAELTNNCWTDSSGNPHVNVLHDSSGNPITSACQQLSLSYLGDPDYSSGTQTASTDYIEEDAHQVADFQRMHAMAQYGNRIYGRVRPYPNGESVLQYWFWYYNQPNFVFFNAFGGHEGDWEGIQIHLDADGLPVNVTYDQHGDANSATGIESVSPEHIRSHLSPMLPTPVTSHPAHMETTPPMAQGSLSLPPSKTSQTIRQARGCIGRGCGEVRRVALGQIKRVRPDLGGRGNGMTPSRGRAAATSPAALFRPPGSRDRQPTQEIPAQPRKEVSASPRLA
jgi:hypothetical protein